MMIVIFSEWVVPELLRDKKLEQLFPPRVQQSYWISRYLWWWLCEEKVMKLYEHIPVVSYILNLNLRNKRSLFSFVHVSWWIFMNWIACVCTAEHLPLAFVEEFFVNHRIARSHVTCLCSLSAEPSANIVTKISQGIFFPGKTTCVRVRTHSATKTYNLQSPDFCNLQSFVNVINYYYFGDFVEIFV